MTYKEVLAEYREHIIPVIQREYEKDGDIDVIARREAWSNFTDSLRDDGQITINQYENWECPW